MALPFLSLMLGLGTAASFAGNAIRGIQAHNYTTEVDQAKQDAMRGSIKARRKERVRQKEYQAQSDKIYGNTLKALTRASYDKAADKSANQFMSTADGWTADTSLPGQDRASTAVSTDIARRVADAAASSRTRLQALARLTASGVVGNSRADRFNTGAGKMAFINSLRRGSLAASQLEQSIPPVEVKEPDFLLADILSGAGSLATAYGSQPDYSQYLG